ncbi:MAG: penicillin-binding protein activator LpoB [Gemmatimonadota bacterium]|nr:penicillin-binding protein activator LpoB [Gemmatimonadota bacterium]
MRFQVSGRILMALPLIALSAAACSKTNVSRIDPASVTDLSGRWNDTDSRLVADELIYQSLTGQWLARYADAQGGEAPSVIVGTFRNRSTEHIPVGTFVGDLERAFVNSGAVTLVAGGAERAELRDERDDQQVNARSDTRASLGQELGAQFILQGEIQSIEDQETSRRVGSRSEKIVFYQVDARLVDLESNIVVWAGQHKIKKYIERPPLGL